MITFIPLQYEVTLLTEKLIISTPLPSLWLESFNEYPLSNNSIAMNTALSSRISVIHCAASGSGFGEQKTSRREADCFVQEQLFGSRLASYKYRFPSRL
jgi:hypothetical protein